jgi:hypothetical protein
MGVIYREAEQQLEGLLVKDSRILPSNKSIRIPQP